MSQTQTFYDPSRTKQLLEKLNQTINEARLVKRVVALKDDLRNIENPQRQLVRINYLKKEIAQLESELQAIRNQMD